MCLERVFTDEEMEEWLADVPEVIEVWKVATVHMGKGYTGWNFDDPAKYLVGAGVNSAKKVHILRASRRGYWSGFHFFTCKKDVGFYNSGRLAEYAVIKCLIRKEWITAVGTEYWCHLEPIIVLVAEKAIFPHYPETEARLEDLPEEKTDSIPPPPNAQGQVEQTACPCLLKGELWQTAT